MDLSVKKYLFWIFVLILVSGNLSVSKSFAVQVNAFEIPSQNISKEKYISVLNNYVVELQLARAVPYIDSKTGEVVGYKLLDIQTESSLNIVGLKNGDVIKHVNFIKVNSASRSLELFFRLKEKLLDSKKLVIGILRKNMEMNLNFNLVTDIKN